MASISNPASSWWTHDVFLSFRGKDIKKGFTGHLYAALCRSGINTFVDDEKMEDCEEIRAARLRGIGKSRKGIRRSRISLVLLSKDYAWSTWCMEELVQILKYKKPEDIWPIFYDVDPSHVEDIQGSYEEAFADHRKRFSEDVLKEWKKALQQVSYLKGLDLQKHLDGHEANNIDHIVQVISKRLDQLMLCVAIHPVGIHFRANEVISLVADSLEDIRLVGIYGMGGIGKSTLAKEVYNFLFYKFDSSCFLENVREVSRSRGIAYLQRQLLTETLKSKHEKIDNVERGLDVIIQSLSHKKVLLVLDDVNKPDQMNKLLGKCDWLLPGSRVIITTRIKNFLEPSGSYWQYEVNELDNSDSLKLLSLHSFGRDYPPKDYLDCADKMVHYTRGIPLALEVLGSSLCGQSVEVWNSRLEKLKVIANDDIHSKLRISYDSLGGTEKCIFLDIACFFIGYDKDYVTSILDGCNFFPIDGINVLLRRCLVKVGSNNKLLMHDLLRDMGRETARQEHAIDPGERSRLWHPEDVIDVLTNKMGTKAVEGLVLNITELENSWDTSAFKKMKMLRLLQLNNVCLTGRYECLSKKLRWLCWREFPLASIPRDLDLEYLVALDMRCSKLKQFSEEGKSLKNLKFLHFNHSLELLETPDFEGCPNLEKLMFKDCISLEKVHRTIGLLKHLRLLSFQDCKRLNNLPGSIGGLTTLEKLNMSGCAKLEELPESIVLLSHLSFLNLQNCENLKNLPESIGNLKSLRELNMSSCSNLEELPESIGFLICLILFNLHDCKNIKNLPGSIGNLKSLEKLNVSGCSKLEELPEDLGNLKSLAALNLDGTAISAMPESIENLKELKSLSLSECQLLFSPRISPHVISFLPCSLTELDLSFCKILDGVIPQDLQGMAQLEDLKLCGNGFKSLPDSIGSLPKLKALSLNDCRWLKSIPRLQSCLDSLHAKHCPALETIDLTNFHGNEMLNLNGCLSLKAVEGFFNLEPLDVEKFEKLLRISSSSMKDLITSVLVRKIDSLTETNSRCPLQALSERGLYSIFLPGSWFPTWFSHQSDGDIVSLQVPHLNPGSKIIGIVTCAIYAWKTSCKSWYFSPLVTLVNKTKMFEWIYRPLVTFLSSDVEKDISWFCYWMFDDVEEITLDVDTCWRFKDEMDEGDEVKFSIDVGFGIEVKKCGIHLLYEPPSQGSQSDDLAMVSYATSRHHKRFSGSSHILLTVEGDQDLKLEDEVPPEDEEYSQWQKKRQQNMTFLY